MYTPIAFKRCIWNRHDYWNKENWLWSLVFRKCEEEPTFNYWYMVRKIVFIYLIMIKSVRECDFNGYKCSLSAIMPYFLQMIILSIQDRVQFIYMTCWLFKKQTLPYMMNLFKETLSFMNQAGYFLVLLLIKPMNTITD